METSELLKKVRKIEIKTRGLSNQIFSGEYHSAFKGRGMTFSEVREYQPGDDIRAIDWNVTARFNHPFIKVFEEEREMTVMLVVDVSASGEFGTQKQLKQDVITELCAVLAFSSLQNNDKVGVIFFSDKIEKFIPAKKGKSHVLRIIRDLIEFKPEQKRTNIKLALKYLTSVIKKRSIAFVISDFMDNDFNDALKIANKKHDLIALRIYDKHEKELPDLGLVKFMDNETGELKWIDTSDKHVRIQFAVNYKKREAMLKDAFTKSGVDTANISTAESYIVPLTNLFKRR
ncbi:MAG: hypothetical protein K0Q95_980 [Bacteroidota bacterium]|jgi:uncharacterized protein (DUF58 family)|nr:hypothetical protein [Bacteroidota bacterium]